MEHFDELHATQMFSMASEFECQAMMFCFKTRFKNFKKGEVIVRQDDPLDDIILIVKGSAIVENIDRLGNISIMARLKKGGVYGVESAYAGVDKYQDSVTATEKTLVLFMNKHRVITPCENRCPRHEIVTKILMKIVAGGNMDLLKKISYMSKKTTREKLLAYLTDIEAEANSQYFELPFNKTELANYLSVDRSAMSFELSKLRDEGVIDFDKNQYRILKK